MPMTARNPVIALATHEVTNQPPPLEDYNLFDHDAPLKEALRREGAAWAEEQARTLGALLGSERVIRLGHDANRFDPELRTFDRFGHRIDEVEFHPA
ncbi:MAG: DNA alkylation response protein, partial [SAR324 cluster bacterium]|nr:DNA alkylation response protein [SAR324 cluster bacterium]